MNNYFRITAYNPENNIGFIADSYGKFEKIWQFSSYLIQHGCKIIEVNNSDNFLNYKNLPLLTEQSDKIIIRAIEEGRTNYIPHVVNGINGDEMCVLVLVVGEADEFHLGVFPHAETLVETGSHVVVGRRTPEVGL